MTDALKFYRKENKVFKTEHSMFYSPQQATRIVRKLARHFNVEIRHITFSNRTQSSYAICYRREVLFPMEVDLLTICHEVAHIHNWEREIVAWSKTYKKHTKKLFDTIGKFIKYCQKRGYWVDELERI